MSQLIYPLPGGVHPPQNKQQSLQSALRAAIIPKQLILPLSQHIGAPAQAIVNVGDHVLAGQMIAKPNGFFSAAIHASSSGEVVAIEDRPLAHPSGMPGPCIVIDCDGEDRWQELTPCTSPFELSNDELLAKIRDAGIAGMGGAGFPAAVKLKPPVNSQISTLILNGTECEPYITADDVLMQTRARDILFGSLVLAKLLQHPDKILIGVEDNKPKAIAALEQALAELKADKANNELHSSDLDNLSIVSFPTEYPSGGEKQLIQILTNKEVPSGGLPAHIGVVLQNVGTTTAIWDAVRFGKPLVERITTVVGESLKEQGNTLVRIGTASEDVLASFGFNPDYCERLIAGGPMMGFSLDDVRAPLVKTSNCLLAPSPQEMPAPPMEQACIRCGQCAEACPASLLPQQLYWYSRSKDHEKLEAHNIMDCIECGACSFVCPSNIPLVQYYRASKGDIRQTAIDKEKSDRSRVRFEFRQTRIDKAEAEKEAKRSARKQAAEAAKAKAALAKAEAPDPASATTSSQAAKPPTDLVAAAVARAQAQQADPTEQLAKLERAVSSAENRRDNAQSKWQECEEAETDLKSKLESRVRQAQLRVDDATKKLAQFKSEQSNAPAQQPVPTAAVTTTAAAPDQAPAVDMNDPVAAAIAKAQARNAMSPADKLAASLSSLETRLAKSEEKLAAAKSNGDDTKVEALQLGLDKLQQKIAVVQQEIAEHKEAAPTESKEAEPAPVKELDAATAAIEKAKSRAAASATMSPEEKQQAQIESLKKRLQKAEDRLAKAEQENDENVSAFKAGAEKLREKLAQLEA